MLLPSFLPDGRLAVAMSGGPAELRGTRVYELPGRGDGELLTERFVVPVVSQAKRYRFTRDEDLGPSSLRYQDLDDPASEPQLLFDPKDQSMVNALTEDRRWMLYTSTRAGERQLYLGPFPPDPDREWAVTADGGRVGFFDERRGRVLYWRENEL